MNTEQDIETPQESSPLVEAGTLLKQKRESLGLTQKQVADRLKLRVTVIEKIEENQFKKEQVATFTRGYLRSYAKAVCLDEKIVLAALDHAGDGQHQEQEMQSFSRKTKTEKHNSRITGMTWGVFSIIVGISSIWWWQNQQQDTLSQSLAESAVIEQPQVDNNSNAESRSNTESELVIEATPVVGELVEDNQMPTDSEPTTKVVTPENIELSQPVKISDINESSNDSTTNSKIIETMTAEVVEAKPTVIAQENTVVSVTTNDSMMENVLNMQFTSDCWIQVKDATGRTLSTGIKKAGQSLNLSGATPYKIVLGAPEGVTITLASEPVDLSGYTSGKVARITLP